MQGLASLTLYTVKFTYLMVSSPCILLLHICGFSTQGFNQLWILLFYSIYYWKKTACKWTEKFTPMLFKGQL